MEVYDEDKHNIRGAIDSGKAVCVQFSAKWCGPCKRITPDMHKLAEENKSIQFYYVDVDEWEEIAGEGDGGFNVAQLPTFVFYKDGSEVASRITGANLDNVKKVIQMMK